MFDFGDEDEDFNRRNLQDCDEDEIDWDEWDEDADWFFDEDCSFISDEMFEDWDSDDWEDVGDWDDEWEYYADEYEYTMVWDMTMGPKEINPKNGFATFSYVFPDDESLMVET